MTVFVDTNVVVRYLTGEPEHLATIASRIVNGDDDIVLTAGVLAEVACVLRRLYDVPRETVVDSLIHLVRKANITVWGLDQDVIIQALLMCRPSGRVSFADAMLWAVARSAGIDSIVYTLDAPFPNVGIFVRQQPPGR